MALLNQIILLTPVLYLDPGSGSLLVQLLMAAVLGAGVAARIYWKKIKALFSRGKKDPIDPTGPEDEP